jgi:hypothetical protein
VSKVKKKPARRSKRRTTVARVSPASLPPRGPDVDTSASVAIIVPSQADGDVPIQADGASKPPDSGGSETSANIPAKKPFWDVGKDSKTYDRAMKILALRATGLDDKSIADTMGLAMQTIWNYCYIAGRNGWADTFSNAQEQIEFGIMPKVVRELEAGLEDNARHQTSGMKVKTMVALKIAEGTVFKRFEQSSNDRPVSNIIAIRIENIGAPIQPTHTYSGTPAYMEGEVDDV